MVDTVEDMVDMEGMAEDMAVMVDMEDMAAMEDMVDMEDTAEVMGKKFFFLPHKLKIHLPFSL